MYACTYPWHVHVCMCTIVTLIANVEQSSTVLAIVCAVMTKLAIPVKMVSQGASKVNISIVIPQV